MGVATAQRDQAAFAYRKTVLNAFREVNDNLTALRTLDVQRAHVAARLAAYKVPHVVHVHPDPLPRNPAGKLLKAVLKREYGAA